MQHHAHFASPTDAATAQQSRPAQPGGKSIHNQMANLSSRTASQRSLQNSGSSSSSSSSDDETTPIASKPPWAADTSGAATVPAPSTAQPRPKVPDAPRDMLRTEPTRAEEKPPPKTDFCPPMAQVPTSFTGGAGEAAHNVSSGAKSLQHKVGEELEKNAAAQQIIAEAKRQSEWSHRAEQERVEQRKREDERRRQEFEQIRENERKKEDERRAMLESRRREEYLKRQVLTTLILSIIAFLSL
ncbi:hypothetical protein Ciccas_003747 [Cichlidogyrus casuarinus]|uniref:Ensconsin n=1 Tax=Cichlidogyrus casuarinus TaxID=1844966 RepID=A0ABD2QED6_9PLAT